MRFQQAVDLAARIPCDADDGDRIIMHRSEYLYSPGIRRSRVSLQGRFYLEMGPPAAPLKTECESGPNKHCRKYPGLHQCGKNCGSNRVLCSASYQFTNNPKRDPQQDGEVSDQNQKGVTAIQCQHSGDDKSPNQN